MTNSRRGLISEKSFDEARKMEALLLLISLFRTLVLFFIPEICAIPHFWAIVFLIFFSDCLIGSFPLHND
jgi:hypothetical protein